MPLEIRELVIKVTVSETSNREHLSSDIAMEGLKEQIINECLGILMAKLEQLQDR